MNTYATCFYVFFLHSQPPMCGQSCLFSMIQLVPHKKCMFWRGLEETTERGATATSLQPYNFLKSQMCCWWGLLRDPDAVSLQKLYSKREVQRRGVSSCQTLLSTLHKTQQLCFCAMVTWSFYTKKIFLFFQIDGSASFLQTIAECSEMEKN